jgi:uncharacterized protein YifN (PemK superfamily)
MKSGECEYKPKQECLDSFDVSKRKFYDKKYGWLGFHMILLKANAQISYKNVHGVRKNCFPTLLHVCVFQPHTTFT